MAQSPKKPAPKKPAAKRAKAGGRKNIDWAAAREFYLSDATLNYPDVAKKFGVALNTVKDRALKETWLEHRQNLADKAYEDFQASMLDRKSASQNRHLKLYDRLQRILDAKMEQLEFHTYLRDKHGNAVLDKNGEPILVQPDGFELEKVAKALKVSIDGERVVLGLPTSVSGVSDSEGGSLWKGLSDAMGAIKDLPDEPDGV